jgi:hypothetical protein
MKWVLMPLKISVIAELSEQVYPAFSVIWGPIFDSLIPRRNFYFFLDFTAGR